MKSPLQILTSVVLCAAVSACQSNSGGGSSNHPAPAPGTPPAEQNQDPTGRVLNPSLPIPPPTGQATEAALVSAVINPNDEVTAQLTSLLSNKSPAQIPMIAERLTDEVFADADLLPAKIFELQNSVAKVAQAGIYTVESANRVALLQANMTHKLRETDRAEVLNHTALIVGSAAAIGALAGSPFYTSLPRVFPALGRLAKRGLTGTRQALTSAYTGVREGVPRLANSLASRESWQTAGQSLRDSARGARDSIVETTRNATTRATEGLSQAASRIRMQSEQVALENLADLELTEDQLAATRDLERVAKDQISGHQFLDTDVAGFRYAVIDQFNGADLGGHRRILLEVTRLVPNAGIPTYVVTPELDAEMTGAIAARLAASPADSQASRLGRFVYLFDRDSGVITRVRSSFAKFNGRLHETGRRMLPLFSKLDWPRTIGTTAVSGSLMGIWYYTAFEDGRDSGETYANLNLEKMVPAASAAAPKPVQPTSVLSTRLMHR